MAHHSGLTTTDLHNPKGLQYAEDVSGFDSATWTNSGLIWNGDNWVAWKSGGTSTGGITGWQALTAGTGVGGLTGTYAISGSDAPTISVDGYVIISSNAESAQQHLLDSGSKYHNAYLSGQKVLDTFNHESYVISSNIYNRTWIDTFSGNVDTRIDAAGGTLAGEMVGNISGVSYAYGLKDMNFLSSQAISGGTIVGNYTRSVVSKTDNYTAVVGQIILSDATSNDIRIDLPQSPNSGDMVDVKRVDGSVYNVKVSGNSNTIDDDDTITMSFQYESNCFVSDGSNYYII